MEKIAVQCRGAIEYKKILQKAYSEGKSWSSEVVKKRAETWEDETPYLGLCWQDDPNDLIRFDQTNTHGYTIISAQEYLEGEVEEFKVGDRVKYTGDDMPGHFLKNGIYTVSRSWSKYLRVLELEPRNPDHSEYKYNFIKLTTKPKTTKENNMNINSSIRTVFVEEDKAPFDLVEKMQNVFGGEIKEDFTGAMILRNNKEEYLAEIKRLDDIEAKRLKEEAKK